MDRPMTPTFPNGLRDPGAELALAGNFPNAIAFLRHRIPDLEHLESSDWDVAVKHPASAGSLTEKMFGRPLVFVSKRFVIQRYFSWGQIDLLPVFEWHGIPYLDQNRFWENVRTDDDGLPRPCVAHDAFIVWMTGLLWGARYSERYTPLISRAAKEQPAELAACLTAAFGRPAGENLLSLAHSGTPGIAVRSVCTLRFLLWLNSLRRNFSATLARQIDHWRTELSHHRKPPYPWIAILGPDGSGKSSVIAGLRQRLQPTRLSIMETHWWPEPLKEGATRGAPVNDPHSRAPRGTFLSIAKTAILCLRWWIARLGKTGHARSKRALLLSDRYFDDLLVDSRRYRYGAPLSWARALFRFLPRPDRVILLLGDPALIHSRKKETTLAEMQRQIAAYAHLAADLGDRATIVDATQPIDSVIDAAFRAAFDPSNHSG